MIPHSDASISLSCCWRYGRLAHSRDSHTQWESSRYRFAAGWNFVGGDGTGVASWGDFVKMGAANSDLLTLVMKVSETSPSAEVDQPSDDKIDSFISRSCICFFVPQGGAEPPPGPVEIVAAIPIIAKRQGDRIRIALHETCPFMVIVATEVATVSPWPAPSNFKG